MNFPVIEMFHSIQGEGMYMGVPSFFIRVSGCNLRCVFKDSICDTPYSSFNPEKTKYNNIDKVVDEFIKLKLENPKTTHIVITGGEPMLYQKGIIEFLNKLLVATDKIQLPHHIYKNYSVTIETNGTINGDYIFEHVKNVHNIGSKYIIDLISMSPKLSTSVDYDCKHISKEMKEKHDKTRINPEIITDYILNDFNNIQLKFVYSGPECIDEILDIKNKIINQLTIKYGIEVNAEPFINDMIYLMPEGTTVDQMNEKSEEVVNQCIKYGWKFAPRLHIMIWGDKRGV